MLARARSLAYLPTMLAVGAALDSSLFWALFIGWILSVVLHEFGHGIVAYWGGDYTIRERGGLTLNPLQYVDPVMSIILPMVFLALGGIPLPGGATYVRRDLLRSNGWITAMSAAGPAMNLLLFFGLATAVSPAVGWVDPHAPVAEWTPPQQLVAALAFLQLFSVILNLLPVPPLDGFNMISPYMSRELQEKATRGPGAFVPLIILFMVLRSPAAQNLMYDVMRPLVELTGVEFHQLVSAVRLVLYNVD